MRAHELLTNPNNWTKSLAVKLPEGKYDLASAIEKCYGEDNYIHIIVGVAAYCIYVWHTGDTESLDYILVHYGFK